jgi:hypothetical protein
MCQAIQWCVTWSNLVGAVSPVNSTCAGLTFLKAQRQSNFVQVRTVYSCSLLCMCIQSSPVKTRTPTQSNLIGRSMTAPPPVLSPSSILPPPSPPCAFIPATKNLMCVSKTLLFQFFTFLKTACPKLRNLKLHSWTMSVFAKCLVRNLGTAQTVLTGVS